MGKYLGINPFAREELIDILNMYRINSGTVLDIGCGNRFFCVIELGKTWVFNTTGIDSSPKAIENS